MSKLLGSIAVLLVAISAAGCATPVQVGGNVSGCFRSGSAVICGNGGNVAQRPAVVGGQTVITCPAGSVWDGRGCLVTNNRPPVVYGGAPQIRGGLTCPNPMLYVNNRWVCPR